MLLMLLNVLPKINPRAELSKDLFQQTAYLVVKHRLIFCDLVGPSFQVSSLDFSDKNGAARSTFPVIDRKILFVVFNEKV